MFISGLIGRAFTKNIECPSFSGSGLSYHPIAMTYWKFGGINPHLGVMMIGKGADVNTKNAT